MIGSKANRNVEAMTGNHRYRRIFFPPSLLWTGALLLPSFPAGARAYAVYTLQKPLLV